MAYQVNGTAIEADEEGYIVNLDEWSKELAAEIAKAENVEMTENHWKVIEFLRNYYDEFQLAPAVRVLVKNAKKKLGADIGNSKTLEAMFPDGAAKQGCKIAGLPKPTGCV